MSAFSSILHTSEGSGQGVALFLKGFEVFAVAVSLKRNYCLLDFSQYFDLAADVLAENAHLTYKFLSPVSFTAFTQGLVVLFNYY